MRLKALAALVFATCVLFPAAALADTDHPVDGSGVTKFRTVIEPGYTCNPSAPTQDSDLHCKYQLSGLFTETTGYLGDGHTGGRMFLDYSAVDPVTGCIPTSGIIKFQTATGFVRTKLAKVAKTCPDPNVAGGLTQDFLLKVTSGADAYFDARGGTIDWTASFKPSKTKPGTLSGPSAWQGTVVTTP
jgi:hypothetical protein